MLAGMARRAGPLGRMARILRRRVVGPRTEARRGPAPEPVPIEPGEPVATVAERLDLGVRRQSSPPHHAYDLDEAELERLLLSSATHAAHRGVRTYVQLPGRNIPLTPDATRRALKAIGRKRPRLRILVRDGQRTTENIAVELWHGSSRALRPRSTDPATQLYLTDAPTTVARHRTDATVDHPIDAVYTWVSAADPGWRRLAADHLDLDAIDGDRYAETDELRYSLRSLETFAPWIERIHILSNCAPPAWLQLSDRIRWVDHAAVMDEDQRPQFNSCAIDTYLHRIPDLSEHFLYLNDDFLLWDSVTPADFFTWDGRTRAHLSPNSSVAYFEQVVERGDAKPSQHSRVNAARLLEDRVGAYPSRLHAHVPYALKRSTMAAMEAEFPEEMASTRAARVRSANDVSFTAFLYHHWAASRGDAILQPLDAAFVTFRNHRRSRVRSSLRTARFACFQDSHGAAADAAYQAFKRTTLETAFPLASAAEVPGGADEPDADAADAEDGALEPDVDTAEPEREGPAPEGDDPAASGDTRTDGTNGADR